MLLGTVAIVGSLAFITRPSKTNNAVVETSQSAESLGYNRILESGNLTLLENKLSELNSKKFDPLLVPVILDNNKRIIELADAVLKHPELGESARVSAIQAKLRALENAYDTSRRNELNDPFVAEQLISSAQQYFDDPNDVLARDARLVHAKGLVIETIQKSSLGSYDRVNESFVDLINRYPADPVVVQEIRRLFTQIRAFDSEESLKLATSIADVANASSSESTADLIRFMKDIIALYDTGIGNFKKIGTIIVDDDEFMDRLSKLNDDLTTGTTVVTQLDNAIEFFERQRKYDKALQLSQKIAANAEHRTHAAAAELAKKSGENGVARNSLLGRPWDFESKDFFGREITKDQFSNRVVLVIMFTSDMAEQASVSQAIQRMAKSFVGKALDLVLVEVTEVGQTPVSSQNKQTWRTVQSIKDNPHKYLVNCPTQRFPYGILIDKNGIVDSINISLSNVKTRIGYLLSLD